MRKYGVLLLVLVLAATSLLAAAAYNNATVTNAATLGVVNTNAAILKLSFDNTRIGNKDCNVDMENGQLKFDFRKGYYSDLGVQPGSVYQWDRLFDICNQSNDTVEVGISTSGLPDWVEIGIDDSHVQWFNWPPYAEEDYFVGDNNTIILGPNYTVEIQVTISCPDGYFPGGTPLFNGTITVTGTAISP